MGILDKVKGLLGGHKAEAKQGVDKAAAVADKATGGEHTDKIDTGVEKADEQIDKLPE